MKILKCPHCGTSYSKKEIESSSGYIECSQCGYVNIVPVASSLEKDEYNEAYLNLIRGKFEVAEKQFNELLIEWSKLSSTPISKKFDAFLGYIHASGHGVYMEDEENKLMVMIPTIKSGLDEKMLQKFISQLNFDETYLRLVRAFENDEVEETDALIVPIYDYNQGDEEDFDTWVLDLIEELKDNDNDLKISPLINKNDCSFTIEEMKEVALTKRLILCAKDESALRNPFVTSLISSYKRMIDLGIKEENSFCIGYIDEPISKIPGFKGEIQGLDLLDFEAVELLIEFITKKGKKHNKTIDVLKEEVESEDEENDDYDEDEEVNDIFDDLENDFDEEFKDLLEDNCPLNNQDELDLLLEAGLGNEVTPPPTKKNNSKPSSSTKVNKKEDTDEEKDKFDDFDKAIKAYKENAVEKKGVLIKFKGYDCEEVVIPSSVKKIDEYAFANCQKLKRVYIPTSVKSIETKAFLLCKGLERIYIPGSVKNIGDKAFAYCTSLEEIILQEGLKEIGNSAFKNCQEARELELPSTLEFIGPSAFFGMRNLENITIPPLVTQIFSCILIGCNNLQSLSLHKNIEYIEPTAFQFGYNDVTIYAPYTIRSLIEESINEYDLSSLKIVYR